MSEPTKTITLECVNDEHFKIWVGELYEDGTVITRWGRADAEDLQFKEFPEAGEAFLEKKKNEKLKKGYVLVED